MKLVPAATGELKTELFSTISGHISTHIIKAINMSHYFHKHIFNQFCNAEHTSYYGNTTTFKM